MIYIAVMGYGTVGSGVVEVLEQNAELIAERAGEEICVKYILDMREFPGDPYEDKIVHDHNIIIDDEEISVVCEAMGGIGAAYQFTRKALEKGKSVCTSNKELVAEHGVELMEIASEHGCRYLFEASVGGGIPIIRTMTESLTAEKIGEISGILNGTTNYILTKMEREGMDFGEALRMAQEMGYAERNPRADVEGYDTCRKIAILSSLMTGKNVSYKKVYTEGITRIGAADFAYAAALGRTIKLLGISKVIGDKVQVMVAPFMIGREDPLMGVDGVYNAVCVRGNMLGDVMFTGKGAGKLATASAVTADVIDCVRYGEKRSACLWSGEEAMVASVTECSRRFFLRIVPDASEHVKEIFPDGEMLTLPDRKEDLGMVTNVMTEKDFREKCGKLGRSVLGIIRMEQV